MEAARLDAATIRASVADVVAESVNKASAGLADTVKKDVGKRVTEDVKSAVAREMTEAKLNKTLRGNDTIKQLREENAKLGQELKTLSDAVKALKRGGEA